jgi:arylsulfatase A-like enzyme
MPVQNILVISIDGLRASALGAYGNTWHPTPALDELAGQSHVFDWMLCDRPTLDGFLDATWPVVERFAGGGIQCALTTDDAVAAKCGETSGFNEIRRIEFMAEQSAATVADTELAQLFAVGIDQLDSWAAAASEVGEASPRHLLWLHARGYHGAWDAPIELRESLLDDDDPPATTFVTPPEKAVGDHDELLLDRAAYAAQTMVLDECVGALMAALADAGLDRNTLAVLTGVRGYALGEHGVVGGEAGGLFSELLHVPCLVRLPGSEAPPPRSAALVQPADLAAILLDALALPAQEADAYGASLLAPDAATLAGRPFIIARGIGGECMLRTRAWMLRKPPAQKAAADDDTGASSSAELYLKPDDHWEANEIADRLPDVASRLLAVLDCAVANGGGAEAGGAQEDYPPLDDDLLSHSRQR